jgi:pyruvate kinase
VSALEGLFKRPDNREYKLINQSVAHRQQAASELLDDVVKLRAQVAADGRATFAIWRRMIMRPNFGASALNLAHYLAFRQTDLRQLQRRLMPLGLSSLGRAEGHVLATLDAVSVALKALAGKERPVQARSPSPFQFFRGERMLSRNAQLVFGFQLAGRARILVTLDEQTANAPEFVLQLGRHGADAVRINCAHDDQETWARMIANVHMAEQAIGQRIPILMDVAGPKVRMTAVATPPESDRLRIGDEILLCRDLRVCTEEASYKASCAPAEIFDDLDIGDPVSIDDGKLRGHLVRKVANGFAARIEDGRLKGLKLKPHRGVNFPGVVLNLDPLTEQDRRELDFVAGNADMVGYSFVETAEHVAQLQDELVVRRPGKPLLPLVAKIETPRAVKNLPEIIVQTAGRQPLAVMIARGDLAVEIGFTRLAEMQEEILWLCEAAHIPVIWATQVLEGLVTNGMPSRGEMTDAAMAGRAECVMLNKGPNVLRAVDTLDRLLQRMSEHQIKKTPTLRALHSWSGEYPADMLSNRP